MILNCYRIYTLLQTQDADAEDPGFLADQLRQQGIMIMVIGIGVGINEAELKRIGGDNRFLYSNFAEVYDFKLVQKMVTKICNIGKIFIILIFIRRKQMLGVQCFLD